MAIGFSRQNNLLLNYSYPISLGNVGTLGAGIGAGIISYSMNPNWIPPQTPLQPI
ncbi:MAG: type IX secretion system membrane protein PorP/SprF [Flavobacteriia bacterium]|nr:type IX secretion system membrane protein PorP/SprF [Flavobacteriia bacterium]